MKKKKLIATACIFFVVFLVIGMGYYSQKAPMQKNAIARVKEFAQAVNYDFETPEKIYPYLTKELRSKMTKSEFVEAFNKERSYPYLSPLFINYESIEMDADNRRGTAIFSQAARLPGMVYEVPLVYENGNYYMDVFHDLADGSYLDKFATLEKQSDWVDDIFSKKDETAVSEVE